MNTVLQHLPSRLREVRLLDGTYVTIDVDVPFTVRTDVKPVRFDFTWFRGDAEWEHSLLTVLIDRLKTTAAGSAHGAQAIAGRFVRDVLLTRTRSAAPLQLQDFADWMERYPPASWNVMQPLLRSWAKRRLPGLSQDIVDFLDSPEKWETRSGQYFALVANSPERGAFTEQELVNIQNAVNRAYEEGRLTTKDWALIWFMIGTGVRPVQAARMSLADIIITDGPEGNGREITLAVPMAKTKWTAAQPRWKRKCPSVLSEVLLRYLATERAARSEPNEHLFYDNATSLSDRVIYLFKRIETYSARLDGPIPIFPYRFRYTLGTRAVAYGYSDEEIARLLTHRRTDCIRYYRAAMPSLQKPIAEKLGPIMAFLASAFQGRLIGNLSEAKQGEHAVVIRDFERLTGQRVGACATLAGCYQDAPRACLTCRFFEPLRGAPWEEFLNALIADRDQEVEDRIRDITQRQIDAVQGIIAQRDATRLAVA